jgi:hypothetical protein
MLLISLNSFGQENPDAGSTVKVDTVKADSPPDYIWIFSSPRLINANTVEILPKGILAFSVTHNFGDVAGDDGGVKNFFGLDNATDVRIGFQYGVSKRLNLIAARAKGASLVQQQYEVGLKYRFLQQANDKNHPVSLTLFANAVASAVKANPLPEQDNSYSNFTDRLSETVQLLIARKFGNVSLQLSPTVVNRNYVVTGDQNTLFALGGAMRLPVKGKFSLLVDYFHTFRSTDSKNFFKSQGIKFYDALGVGIEIVTAGHVFHMNFTNATEILENRFIPRTVTSWSKGQFRWGFTIARDFDLLYKRNQRRK